MYGSAVWAGGRSVASSDVREIWNRPDLDHRQRMICALAAFTAIGLQSQLGKFALSALNTGLTRERIVEIIMQTGPYSGFPQALNALSALDDTLG